MDNVHPSLDEQTLNQIVSALDGASLIDENTLAPLREIHCHLRFTLCSEDDMGMREPYLTGKGYDLHLVAVSDGGCSSLTLDPENCGGLVIAVHEE